MTYKQRIIRKQLLTSQQDISIWPQVDKSALTGEMFKLYEKREKIIYGYFSGLSLKDLSITNQVSRRHIHRLVDKCLKTHKDGNIWGFRALIPYKQQKDYNRNKQIENKRIDQRSGMSGALMKLFETYPDIKEEIEAYFLKRTEKILIHESRITYKSTFKRFINACRAKAINAEYPFNAKYMGYRSLIEYLKKLALTNYGEATKARCGNEAINKLKLGGVEQQMMPVTSPYERVEFDGHHIDIVFVLEVPSPHGGTTDVPVDRVWLLLVRESFTGAVLGYHLSFSREYNLFDVMQCIKKTIMPWKPRRLSIPALNYPEHGGIPSAVLKEAQWAIFQEFCYDNAKAHLSNEVTRVLVDVVGCNVNAGPVNFPERRAMIERFFGIFEENGFHRLPSTLGSNPKDPRRKNPEKMAQKYKIRIEHIEDLIEVLIADYNGTPSERNGHRSPLEQLRLFLTDKKALIPKLEDWKRRRLCMFDLRYERTIRGSVKEGKRPYIVIEGAKYTNNVLSTTPELINKKLIIYINPEDLRYGEAYFSDGAELGMLQAIGFWGRTPHTIHMRRAINKNRHNQLKHYADNEDVIQNYLDNVQKEALAGKKGRHKLINVTKAQRNVEIKSIDKINNSSAESHNNRDRVGQRKIDPEMWDQKAYVD